MPLYEYRARDRAGAPVSGVIEAAGPAQVAGELDGLGYFPVQIRPRAQRWRPPRSLAAALERFRRVKKEDFILFNRQMATLVAAGLPFIRSLDTVIEQTKCPRLAAVLQQVRYDVEGGSSFSDALARHTSVFPGLYVNMVRAGEEGGILDRVLDRLATLAEHEAVIRSRISAAVRYPMLVVAALVAAIALLMKLVVPQFASLYERFETTLPLPTRILIAVNGLFRDYWVLLLAGVVLLAAGTGVFLRSRRGRRFWDRLKIRLPVFGPLFLKASMSRFSRVFASLIESGIPILRTLEIVSATVGNTIIEQMVLNIRDGVREGEPLAAPMKVSGVFPPIVVQMVAVGEETGRLDEMLVKVSEYYDNEVEYAIRNLTTALEPLLILVIGGVVLFLALAIFMPWWNVISFIRR